ncbi:unnamed protein product, partial [Durusdinium trenchii]
VLADNLWMVAVGNPLDKDIIFKGDKAYNRALARNLCRLRTTDASIAQVSTTLVKTVLTSSNMNEESTKVAKVKGSDSKPTTPERVGGQNKNKEANDVEPEKQVKEDDNTPAGDSGGTTASAELGGLVGQAAALLKSLHSVTLKAINVKSLDMGTGAALG